MGELGEGKGHQASSFYLALHSEGCRGSCMILDDEASPLTRSWCLFELLQALKLENSKASFLGLVFSHATGVLNKGATPAELALKVGKRVGSMSLKDADAT